MTDKVFKEGFLSTMLPMVDTVEEAPDFLDGFLKLFGEEV